MAYELPEDCPVIALGKTSDGCFFRDPLGIFTFLKADAGKAEIEHLFAPHLDYLCETWPRENVIAGVRYDAEAVRTALFNAAASKGVFDPQNPDKPKPGKLIAFHDIDEARSFLQQCRGSENFGAAYPDHYGVGVVVPLVAIEALERAADIYGDELATLKSRIENLTKGGDQ